MANGRANACAANPTSDLAISNETLHLDRFLSFNQRKNRFSWNGDVDDLEQFLKARFVMGIEDGDSTSGKLRMSCSGSCAVLKLPRATFNFYLNTKTLQIQGSACGDISSIGDGGSGPCCAKNPTQKNVPKTPPRKKPV